MKRTSKLLSLFLALTMAIGLVTPAMAVEVPEAGDSMAGKVVILHTNDTHGGDAAGEKSIGTAGVAQLKKDFEAAGATVLLLSAGDAIQGDPLVNLDKGASAIEFMNAAGYDAMCPGNHEFDYGRDNLEELADKAEFPILCANLVNKSTGKPIFEANKVFELEGGKKIGVFGLATPETASKANPKYVEGLEFLQGEKLYECAQKQVDELKAAGCDLIVCLGHLGVDEGSEPNRSIDVASHVNGIDLFVDGHSHSDNETIAAAAGGSNVVNGALIVSTGTKLANVGVYICGEEPEYGYVSAGEYTGSDPDVAKLIDERSAAVDSELSAVFAKSEVLLDGNRAPGVRTQETNLGDFAADAILWQAREYLGGDDKVDAAFTNGGGIRDSIAAGDVTMKTMKTVFPFGNAVYTLDLTGAQILEMLEANTNTTPTANGGFPQVSGMSFTIDTTVPYVNGEKYGDTTFYAPAEPGARVKDVKVGGEPLDLDKTYTLATNDFTAAGGDAYYVLTQAANGYNTTVSLEDALVNYTREVLGGVITAEKYGESAGRIKVLTEADIPAGGGNSSSSTPSYSIGNSATEVENGSITLDKTSAKAGATVTITTKPAEGYVVDNITVKTADGKTVEVKTNEDGTYSFTMPSGKVTVEAAFKEKEVDILSDYADLESGAWYADAARYVLTEGYMAGTGKGNFSPNGTVTRGTVYQTLYNMAGKPAVAEPATFTDVAGKWYADAAAWAEDEGLTTGTGKGEFSGDKAMTRQELAKVFSDYAAMNCILSTEEADLSAYSDADQVAAWAKDGVESAVALGIIKGNKDKLNPTGTAVRTELAQILKNYDALEPTYVETVVSIEVPAQDGIPAHTVPGTLTLPTSASKDAQVPGVVMLHGTGSNRDEAGGGYAIAAPVMAAYGIATLRIDFMGNGDSTASYTDYCFTSANIDAKAAADYLAKLDVVDGDALGVMGWSQGGTNALLAAAAYPDTFKAVVTWAGAMRLNGADFFEDYNAAYETAKKDGYVELTFDWREPLHIGPRWFEECLNTDKAAEVAKIKGPILAINGLSDTTVTPDNADQIVAASTNDASMTYFIEDCDHTFNVFSGDFSALGEAVGAGIAFFQEVLGGVRADAAA